MPTLSSGRSTASRLASEEAETIDCSPEAIIRSGPLVAGITDRRAFEITLPLKSAFGFVVHLLTASTFPEPTRPVSQLPFQSWTPPSEYPSVRNAEATRRVSLVSDLV